MQPLTREEILKKIADHGGEWKPLDELRFIKHSDIAPENDPDGVYVYVELRRDRTLKFWLMGHYEDAKEFFPHGLNGLDDITDVYNAAGLIATAIGYDMPGAKLKVVEKTITVGNVSKEAKLEGTVEAYEKLLIGRAITVSA